ENFDRAMIALVKEHKILEAGAADQLNMDEENKVIIFSRGDLVFIFNFHPTGSIFDYKFQPPKPGSYKILLSSDDQVFGGFERVDTRIEYGTFEDNGREVLSLYLTNRTALVLKKA